MLSHNVRMPMSIISGYGELLRLGLLSEEEQKDIINNICDNTLSGLQLETIEKLCQILDCTPNELFNITDE